MRLMNGSENQTYFKKSFILKHCFVLNIALKMQEIPYPWINIFRVVLGDSDFLTISTLRLVMYGKRIKLILHLFLYKTLRSKYI